jgi:molybdopterin converting factor small subunit
VANHLAYRRQAAWQTSPPPTHTREISIGSHAAGPAVGPGWRSLVRCRARGTIHSIVQVRIRLGAGLMPLAPSPMLTLELPSGATVDELYRSIGATHPELAPTLRSALAVMGGSQVERQRPLRHGDEVALLLPAAGGGTARHPV